MQQVRKYPILPANDAVQNWFEENIDKECSASSAIYKFRLWLESLQRPVGSAVWVKATDRLPGWGQPVHWRIFDGQERGFKETLAEMIHVSPVSLHSFEWLSESQPNEQPAIELMENEAVIKWFFDNRKGLVHVGSLEQLRELYNEYQQSKNK